MAAFAYRAGPVFIRRLSADAKRPILSTRHSPDIRAWPDAGLHAAWIGHSTVVLKIDGLLVLTDPVFSPRIGVKLGPMTLGLKRLVEPAADIPDLPRPDLILLSHAHMDHFDLPSLRRLQNRGTTVITARNTRDLLRGKRFAAVRELGWNETTRVGNASVEAFEVRHWGARFRRIRSSKRFDLAIMPIGAYDPWIHVHWNPEQALAMANDAGAEFVLPVHHRTFQLSREPAEEPMERLLQAAGAASDRVCIRDFGQESHWK